jgi:hypothetical protein
MGVWKEAFVACLGIRLKGLMMKKKYLPAEIQTRDFWVTVKPERDEDVSDTRPVRPQLNTELSLCGSKLTCLLIGSLIIC